MEIEDAAFGESATQRFPYLPRIDSRFLCHSQRLGDRIDGLRHDELVRQLGHLAGSCLAHVRHRFPDDFQQRLRSGEALGTPPAKDGKIPRLRTDLPSGDRGIEPVRAALSYPLAKSLRLGISSGSEIDDQRTGRELILEGIEKGLDDVSMREVQAENAIAHRLRQGRRIRCHQHSLLGGPFRGSDTSIPNHYRGTRGEEVFRHGPAHVPQSYESDLVTCQCFAHLRSFHPSRIREKRPMKVLITGGGGFLGSQLARQLLERKTLIGSSGEPEPIDEICLLDSHFSPAVEEWAKQQGQAIDLTLLNRDLADREAVFAAVEHVASSSAPAVFHLAAMVSGECEQRFEDAIAVNLDGTRHLLEALRLGPGCPRIVFASSVAAFGGEAMTDPVADRTKQTPQTTYGMTKVIGELMINDYSRKGFLDGRSARLPTIIIRPGKPNAAASSWASGMFREPLNGETCYLPVHRDQLHPVLGYRDVVDSFIALHEASPDLLTEDRGFGLPSHRVSVNEALTVLEQVAAEKDISLGMVLDDFDPVIQAIVDSWPTATDGARALRVGVPQPKSLANIIRDYIADFLSDSDLNC